MQQPRVDHSDSDFYHLSSSFDTTEMATAFSGSHSRSISSESMLGFLPREHPSLDLYKTNHIVGHFQQSEEHTQRGSRTPPGPPRTQRSSAIPTSKARPRSHAYSDGEEGPEGPLPEDATEQEKIDWRRRQNTLAARKSRKRKLEQMQQLQDDVQRLSKEKDVWRERALMMKQLLMSHGLPAPNFVER
ncbi:hypothetical protein BYT27DRAFT_6465717 [Phlegmacium glaucopus]|nr:hypothetical protein BYT27DRAFT_6465717 [Phlegmacium glaucopus]